MWLEVLDQIHSLIQMRHLFAVTIEQQRVATAALDLSRQSKR